MLETGQFQETETCGHLSQDGDHPLVGLRPHLALSVWITGYFWNKMEFVLCYTTTQGPVLECDRYTK